MKSIPRMRCLVGRALTVAIVLAYPAMAQGPAAPGVQSVVAFMRVLDIDAVRAAEARHGEETPAAAAALLEALEARTMVAADLADAMQAALRARHLPRATFVLFLADLLNGLEALETRETRDAERQLERIHCGLVIPNGTMADGAAERMLDGDDVGAVVGQFVANAACILRGIGGDYRDRVF